MPRLRHNKQQNKQQTIQLVACRLLQECASLKAAAKEADRAAAAAQAEAARAAEAAAAAAAAHGEEASRLRRIAKKKAEELESCRWGGVLSCMILAWYAYR